MHLLPSDLKSHCLLPTQTLGEALDRINAGGRQFALVIDHNDHLLGIITDGNVRRAFLTGGTVQTPVSAMMNASPLTAQPSDSSLSALQVMVRKELQQLPIVDATGRLCGVWQLRDLKSSSPLPHAAVFMAGGLGSRLGELTRDCPKPMLHVGGKPILRLILDSFLDAGFRHFYFAVNYKASIIEDYFGDGSKFDCSIQYLKENERMGTAGALALLPQQERPFLVVNADVLTHLNMRCLLFQHFMNATHATMVVRRHSYQIPYGVIEQDDTGRLLTIREKPDASCLVSAGMYALSPEALAFLPPQTFVDMPEFFQKLVDNGHPPHILESDAYWLDVGRVPDFERAQREFL